MAIDFEADALASQPFASPDDGLITAISRYRQLEAEEAEIRARLDEIRAHKREILQRDIVAIMDTRGQATTTLDNGTKVEIVPYVNGGLVSLSRIRDAEPEEQEALIDRRRAALGWLREHGHGDKIATVLSVDVGKSEKLRSQVLRALSALDVVITEQETVHPQTLGKLLRDLCYGPQALPTDQLPTALFDLQQGRTAKISISNPRRS